jgi:predicted Fe-S protein YdhL (DUF1289 family)
VVQAEGANVSAVSQSPCINVCQMDEASGWCKGCLRTIDEIVVWSRLSDAQRAAVLGQLPQRRAARARSRPGGPGASPGGPDRNRSPE